MAYRIYISRAETPGAASDDPISLKEWTTLVDDIPDLHFFEGEDALPSHITTPAPSEGLARWTGHPRRDDVWFNHDKGNIYVEGFDAYVTMRLRSLANRLRARVIDEDGRTF